MIITTLQLDFGIPGACGEGAYTARQFINFSHAQPNACNRLEHESMLLATYNKCPEMYPFVKQCYLETCFL